MNIELLQEKILDGIEKLANANNAHEEAARLHGVAEHNYRQLRANEFVKASLEKDDSGKKLTDTHKNALVDIKTDNALLAARFAESRHEAACEVVKSLKT